MRRIILLLVMMIAIVGVIQAQDDPEELAEPIFTIVIQNYDAGEFVETDEANIFTLTLEEPVEITDLLSVAPSLRALDFQTELFNTALESTSNLEAYEAVLTLEDQQVTLLLSDFVRLDLETVQFTAEAIEVTTASGEGVDLELEFDEAELVVYLNSANTELLNASLESVGGGLRCFPNCNN